ncbi:MAG: HisA/HisF-related TIM barrel protein [Promethearchaeota archaeon]
MKTFKIIPVIDILNSEAVHAKEGERDKYLPLKSRMFNSTNPIKIIKTLKYKYKFNEIYIADLDSIINKKLNYQIFDKISKIPDLYIMVDPGIVNFQDVSVFSKYKFNQLIIGLETINNLEIISKSISLLGQNRLIISIDMYKGKIISKLEDLNNKDPKSIINQISNLGITNIILLDLFRVGQKFGGIPALFSEIVSFFNGNVFVGGGIKNQEDFISYKKQKFSGVLVATALYDGTINIKKVRKFL